MTERHTYAFETFPRGDLTIKIDRRQALLTVATQLKVRERQSRGEAAYRLSALGSLADERLAVVSPVPVPGCAIAEQDGFVWAHVPGVERPTKLFPVESAARSVFNRFDGRTMLEVVARHLSAEVHWDDAKAFAYVRGVFLYLTELGVCLPN